MKTRLRINTLTACVAAALAQMAASSAFADSGVGVDTVVGNAANPGYAGGPVYADPEATVGKHTPSAQPFALPPLKSEEPKAKTEGGWEYSGSIQAGVLGVSGDKSAAKYREYRDLKNGFLLNNLGLQFEKPGEARFFEATAFGVGQKDQSYGVSFGRYNDWKVNAFYNETVHLFTSTYRSLWSGVGTNNLTLNGLTPGGTTSAAVTQPLLQAAITRTPNSDISLTRKKGGIRLDMNLVDDVKFFASYSNEKREGARPFGTVFGGGGGGGNIETLESIDYNTHDFLAGIQYNSELSSLNVLLNASLFRNNIDTETIQNPLYITTNTIAGVLPTAFTQARYDLYPSNDYFNIKGEYARLLPSFYNGRVTAVVSAAKFRQNDNLIAPTTNALTGGTINSVIAANAWNNPATALSKQTAGADIGTQLVDLGLSLNPVNALDVKGKLRYYATDNSTDYSACNPQTGQWGRLLNDGSGGAVANFLNANGTALTAGQVTALNVFLAGNGCNQAALKTYLTANSLVPSAGNVNIHNIPYEYKQLNFALSADYRFSRLTSINASFERENFERKHRERDKTWEDKWKLGYVNRGVGDGTLRLSFENDRRRGSNYNSDPYEEFYSASLGDIPNSNGATIVNLTSWIHTNDLHRKFDLADRDQGIINARLNYPLASNLDAGVTLQIKDARFPNSEFGRNDHQKQNSLNFDLNYQPSAELNVYGFYSYQDGKMKQRGVQPNGCTAGNYYYFLSDGSVVTNTTGIDPTTYRGVTIVSRSGLITTANFEATCATASATSPLYPTGRFWDMSQTDRNDVLGLGLKYDFGKAKLDLSYTYSVGRTGIRYNYNAAGLGIINGGGVLAAPTAAQLADVALIGDGFSDLVSSTNVFQANLLVPIDKKTSVRLMYSYQTGKIRDWHYDGVAANPVPANNAVYLDSGPQDYKISTFGALLRFDF